MPAFEYTNNYTRASVPFPAHKFPHTSSVYYQCNVSLCINNGNCAISNDCKATTTESTRHQAQSGNVVSIATGSRRKRFATKEHSSSASEESHAKKGGPKIATSTSLSNQQVKFQLVPTSSPRRNDDMTFDVYSGLLVSDSDIDGKSINNKANYSCLIYYITGTNSIYLDNSTIARIARDTGVGAILDSRSSGNLEQIDSAVEEQTIEMQTSMVIVIIGLVVIAVALASVCQIGFVACKQQQQSPSTGAYAANLIRCAKTADSGIHFYHHQLGPAALSRSNRASLT